MDRVLQCLSFEGRAALVAHMFPNGLTAEQIHLLVVSETTSLFALFVPQVINALMLSRLAPHWRIGESSKMRPVLTHARRHFERDAHGRAVIDCLVKEANGEPVSLDSGKLWPYYPRGIDLMEVSNIAPEIYSRILSRMPPFHALERIRLPLHGTLTHSQAREVASSGFTGIIMPRYMANVIVELRPPLALLHVSAHILTPSEIVRITTIPTLRELQVSAAMVVVPLQQMAVSMIETLRIRDCAGITSSRGCVLETLRTLEISGTKDVGDGIWQTVAEFAPHLVSLAVESCPMVQGRGVSALHRCRRLVSLSVCFTSFEPSGLAAINSMTALERLSVHCTRVTQFGALVEQLGDHPSLVHVTHSCLAGPEPGGCSVKWKSECVTDSRAKARAATLGTKPKSSRPSIMGTFQDI